MTNYVKRAAAVAAIGTAGLLSTGANAFQRGGISPGQLVGAWVTVGQTCSGGPGVRFRANGRYETQEAGGRWTLRGNRLSLTNWGGGNNVPVQLLRNGRLVIRWNYGTETFRRC